MLFKFIILLLYMDDMLIVGRDTGKIDKLKKELSKSFEMNDLGSASQILGIKISQDKTNEKLWLLIGAKICALMAHIRYDLCTKGHSNHPT